MNRFKLTYHVYAIALLLPFAAIGCSRPQPTPPEVTAEYRALVEGLDVEHPGASVARLTEFAQQLRGYDIVIEAEQEIARLESLADGRYHQARELAREGEFDRAEAMLEDLATYLPDTPDGKSAQEYLAFDFHHGKAQWLMVRQRFEEGGEVARRLLDHELTRAQQEQVETLLDGVGQVAAARSQATRAQAQSACHTLLIHLEMFYAERGEYPKAFALSDIEEWDPHGSRSILRALSSIESYRQTERGVSFTAVSTTGDHRIRVVDGVLER